jgi:glutamate-1-semialdehyde aminotransferase
MTAGYVVLGELEKGAIHPYINRLASDIQKGIIEIGERKGYPILVNRAASILQIHFGVSEIRNKRDHLRADKNMANLFHLGLRAHGVMASYHPLFISAAHTDAHAADIFQAAEDVLKSI